MRKNSSIEIRQLAPFCGAEITGVDLNTADDGQLGEVVEACAQYGVVTLPDQDLTPESQIRLANRFGRAEVHPIVNSLDGYPEVVRIHKAAGDRATFGVGWHSDNSFQESPSAVSILAARKIPPLGGDTLFASQYAAYDALSDGMKDLLDGMIAVHSAKYAYTTSTAMERYDSDETTISYKMSDAVEAEIEHPVIRSHPETRRKALYVNAMFTIRFKDMTEEESKPMLRFLCQHATRVEFQCRVRWTDRAVTMWDNRCVQHYAMDDYPDYERVLDRVTVAGKA